MSHGSKKDALRELAELKSQEFGRALIRMWPLELEGMERLTARAKSLSALEDTVRVFVVEAIELSSHSSEVAAAHALVDDEVARLLSALEERLLRREFTASRGLSLGETTRSEIDAVRSRMSELIRQRQMQSGTTSKSEKLIETRGRHPKHDWAEATNQVWGLIHRGELTPRKQADIEWALVEALSVNGAEPEASNVRKYARRIWKEYQRDS